MILKPTGRTHTYIQVSDMFPQRKDILRGRFELPHQGSVQPTFASPEDCLTQGTRDNTGVAVARATPASAGGPVSHIMNNNSVAMFIQDLETFQQKNRQRPEYPEKLSLVACAEVASWRSQSLP